jgi:hypothetical protein
LLNEVQDLTYLGPYIEAIEKEDKERMDLDAMTVKERKGKA